MMKKLVIIISFLTHNTMSYSALPVNYIDYLIPSEISNDEVTSEKESNYFIIVTLILSVIGLLTGSNLINALAIIIGLISEDNRFGFLYGILIFINSVSILFNIIINSIVNLTVFTNL